MFFKCLHPTRGSNLQPRNQESHALLTELARGLSFFKKIFSWVYLFISGGRERESTSRGGAERRRDRIPSRLRTISAGPDSGLELPNLEIMTWAEIKNWTLNRLSDPGAPSFFFLVKKTPCFSSAVSLEVLSVVFIYPCVPFSLIFISEMIFFSFSFFPES